MVEGRNIAHPNRPSLGQKFDLRPVVFLFIYQNKVGLEGGDLVQMERFRAADARFFTEPIGRMDAKFSDSHHPIAEAEIVQKFGLRWHKRDNPLEFGLNTSTIGRVFQKNRAAHLVGDGHILGCFCARKARRTDRFFFETNFSESRSAFFME